jgi:hypothetical protein
MLIITIYNASVLVSTLTTKNIYTGISLEIYIKKRIPGSGYTFSGSIPEDHDLINHDFGN